MNKLMIIAVSIFLLAGAAAGQDFNATREAFTKSYSYERENKFTEAAGEMKKIYDAGSYEMNLRLGWLTYRSGAMTESMDYYQKAIDLKPYAIEARFGYVLPAVAAGNMTKVEEQYKQILTVDPLNSRANYWMGMISYNREQYDAALKYFEKVVNLYPFDYDSVIMYAWTHYKMNNLREAKVLFQKALLINPDDTSAMEGLKMIQ
jgi:tetratricopeptide (TPR) repeat protein